jgi:hypothetical protein
MSAPADILAMICGGGLWGVVVLLVKAERFRESAAVKVASYA